MTETEKKKLIPPPPLQINRLGLFDPDPYIGQGSSIWKGPLTGDGLEGAERQDQRSLLITEIDFSQITRKNNFLTCLKSTEEVIEKAISGTVKLDRLTGTGNILADARIGQALFLEKGHTTLHFLSSRFSLTCFELFGTILRDPTGEAVVMGLGYSYDNWKIYFYFLKHHRYDTGALSLPSTENA